MPAYHYCAGACRHDYFLNQSWGFLENDNPATKCGQTPSFLLMSPPKAINGVVAASSAQLHSPKVKANAMIEQLPKGHLRMPRSRRCRCWPLSSKSCTKQRLDCLLNTCSKISFVLASVWWGCVPCAQACRTDDLSMVARTHSLHLLLPRIVLGDIQKVTAEAEITMVVAKAEGGL